MARESFCVGKWTLSQTLVAGWFVRYTVGVESKYIEWTFGWWDRFCDLKRVCVSRWTFVVCVEISEEYSNSATIGEALKPLVWITWLILDVWTCGVFAGIVAHRILSSKKIGVVNCRTHRGNLGSVRIKTLHWCLLFHFSLRRHLVVNSQYIGTSDKIYNWWTLVGSISTSKKR